MTLRPLSLQYPIATGFALLLIAGLFRLVDIFVFRLDERWGEIIVSKTAGLVVLLGFLVATNSGLRAAGFHARAVVPSLMLGCGLTLAALSVGYLAEMIVQARRGAEPVVELAAIDPKSGLAGAAGFALLLLIGNLVNSFTEEGLFRGLLIPLFRREVDRWPALVYSAFLFGAWHLPWAFKTLMSRGGGARVDAASEFVANFLPQALLGVVWGYLYLRTGNLWGCWAAHTLTNSAVNFIHVRSSEGIDAQLSIRMTVFTMLMLLGLVVVRRVGDVFQLREVRPWGV